MSHHQRTRAVAITIAAQYSNDIGRASPRQAVDLRDGKPHEVPRPLDLDLGVYEYRGMIWVPYGDNDVVGVDRDGKVTES